MSNLTVQFRYSGQAERPVCARFIAQSDPAEWLKELVGWGIPLDQLRLYPVPRSRADNSCLGVLVAPVPSQRFPTQKAGGPETPIHSNSPRPGSPGRGVGGEGPSSIPQTPSPPAPLPRVQGRGEPATLRENAMGLGQVSTQPYGCIANRLYLPVEARVSVELRDMEWGNLLGPTDTEYVWHPVAGLVAFANDEVLTVADLLVRQVPQAAVDRSATDWSYARPGVLFPSRIASIRADLPTVFVLMAEGRGDIGTLAKPLDQMPVPVLHQIQSAARRAGQLAWAPFAALGGLLSRLAPQRTWPHARAARNVGDGLGVIIALAFVFLIVSLLARNLGPTLLDYRFWLAMLAVLFLLAIALLALGGMIEGLMQSGWLKPNRTASPTRGGAGTGMFATLGAGIQRQIAGLVRWSASLLDARQRELDRLIKMLKENPDEGLKYALPMAGDAARGIAPPGSSLMSRSVDFQLGSGGGSGPADVWALDPNTQLQLIARYRELAAREVQLGRYRRAAYIFAELLGDLNSAASTLVQGRFYREAAVLYRDKLNRPLEAAQCLEQGGLLLDAIPLYRQQGQLEKVGDLYRKLEDHDQADAAYREAVESTLNRHDYLDAARLLQQKLDAPDEALVALDTGWPDSTQARNCLKNSFTLLSDLGRHDEAQRRIRDLRQAVLAPHRAADAIEVLSSLANNAPHAGSRAMAADSTRVMASQALKGGQVSRHQITAAVARLAIEDKLLSRDCSRAAENKPWEPKRPVGQSASAGPPKGIAELIATFRLPTDVRWLTACGTQLNFYVAGRRGWEVIVARGSWGDPSLTVTTINWELNVPEYVRLLVSFSMGESTPTLWIGSTGDTIFPPRPFRRTDGAPKFEIAVTPSWMPRRLSGLTTAPDGMFFTFQMMEMLLTGFDPERNQTVGQTINLPLLDQTVDPNALYDMVANAAGVFLAIDHFLVTCDFSGNIQVRDVYEPIWGLAASRLYSPSPRLLVLFDSYGLYLEGLGPYHEQRLDFGFTDPQAIFLGDGRLAVQGDNKWLIYDKVDGHLKQVRELKCEAPKKVLTLLRTDEPGRIAVITADGQVRVYDLP